MPTSDGELLSKASSTTIEKIYKPKNRKALKCATTENRCTLLSPFDALPNPFPPKRLQNISSSEFTKLQKQLDQQCLKKLLPPGVELVVRRLMRVTIKFQPRDVIAFLADYMEGLVEEALLLSAYNTVKRSPQTVKVSTQCTNGQSRDDTALHAAIDLPDSPRLQLPRNLPPEDASTQDAPLKQDIALPPYDPLVDAFIQDNCTSEAIDQFYSNRFFANEEASLNVINKQSTESFNFDQSEVEEASTKQSSDTSTSFADESDQSSPLSKTFDQEIKKHR